MSGSGVSDAPDNAMDDFFEVGYLNLRPHAPAHIATVVYPHANTAPFDHHLSDNLCDIIPPAHRNTMPAPQTTPLRNPRYDVRLLCSLLVLLCGVGIVIHCTVKTVKHNARCASNADKKALRAKIQAHKRDLATCQSEYKTNAALLQETKRASAIKAQELEQCSSQIATLKSVAEKNSAAMQTQSATHTSEINTLRAQLADKDTAVTELSQQTATQQEMIAQLNHEQDALKLQLQTQATELDALRDEHTALTANYVTLSNAHTALTNDISALEQSTQEVTAIQQQIAALRQGTIPSPLAAAAGDNNGITKLEQDLQAKQLAATALQTSVHRQVLDSPTLQIAHLNQMSAALDHAVSEHMSTVTALRTQYTAINETIIKFEKSITECIEWHRKYTLSTKQIKLKLELIQHYAAEHATLMQKIKDLGPTADDDKVVAAYMKDVNHILYRRAQTEKLVAEYADDIRESKYMMQYEKNIDWYIEMYLINNEIAAQHLKIKDLKVQSAQHALTLSQLTAKTLSKALHDAQSNGPTDDTAITELEVSVDQANTAVNTATENLSNVKVECKSMLAEDIKTLNANVGSLESIAEDIKTVNTNVQTLTSKFDDSSPDTNSLEHSQYQKLVHTVTLINDTITKLMSAVV